MIMQSFVAIALATAAVGQTSNVTYHSTISSGLAYPARLAPAPGGGIYVTDPPMKLVAEYDATQALVGSHAVADGAIGIAVHTDGRIFISHDNGTIGVYDTAFAFLYAVNPAPLTLTGPNDLAFDSTTNELYAVDSGSNRIMVFVESMTATWTLARSWGTGGSTLGTFTAPQAIAIDPDLGRVLVTDVDNFRVQVFNTTGIFLFKFGYRIMYLPTNEVAWFARSEGLTLDACGNIYVADALMGTVRAFNSFGQELSASHTPVVGYGSGPGQLRVPCDIMIDSGKLYVASTNNAEVEVYTVACTETSTAAATVPFEPREKLSRTTKELRVRSTDRDDGSVPVRAGVPQMPDNPAEIVAAINSGVFREDLDLNRDRVIDIQDLEIAVVKFGAGTIEDFVHEQGGVAAHPALNPPHILDLPNRCGLCHSMDGAPGGMLTAAGQENLCQSCHSAGKIAGSAWIGPGNEETNHPWGVSAYDADPGPAPDSEVALHLDAGKVRCGTCHDPHESFQGICDTPSSIPGWEFPSHIGSCNGGSANGEPCQSDAQCEMTFMRTEGNKVNLCGECHVQYDEWLHAGHSDEHADPWSHYDWSMGNNWLCTGPGTPYAYCTDVDAGTATSAGTAICTSAGMPLACCTGPGTGTCTVANASCLGAGNPWPCCTGVGTGTCANNLSAAACTGAGTPMACCTGVGTGSCSSRESCRQCHSGNGYIDFSEDFPDGVVQGSRHRGHFRVVDCLVCHATHGKSHDQHLLRIYDDVRLPTGQMITDAGASAACISCHNGRAAPPVPNPPGVTTPHYLNGGAMLEGINAVTTFDGTEYVLTSSQHTQLLNTGSLGCPTCHMAPVPTSGPGAGKVGGHTFNLVDHESGFENVDNTCNAAGCHSGLTTINRTANGDYDGNGLIQGIQTETHGLLILLKDALNAAGAFRLLLDPDTGLPTEDPIGGLNSDGAPSYPYWTTKMCSGGDRDGLACNGSGAGTAPFNCPGGGACNSSVPAGEVATVEDAIWNWEYVDNSEDLGVKNTGYAIGLLQIAYKGVTDQAVPSAAYRYSPAP